MDNLYSEELVFTMAFYAMSHTEVIKPFNPNMDMERLSSFLPYWKKLSLYALNHWTENAMELAKRLCKFAGVDPEKTSVGLGSIMRRDVEYQLWMAWMPTAQGLIQGYRAHLNEDNDGKK